MQAISIGFGKETFKVASISLSAFVVTPPFQRELPSKVYARQGHIQKFPASNFPEINGSLYLDTLRVPDGVLLLLQSSHRMRGTPLRDGALLLRTRSAGPMLAIRAALPAALEALQTGDFLVFQGRADVLPVSEYAEWGLEPPKNWVNGFTDDEEVAECYTIEVHQPEVEAKPQYEKLQDAEGNTVVAKKRPGRRIRLRS